MSRKSSSGADRTERRAFLAKSALATSLLLGVDNTGRGSPAETEGAAREDLKTKLLECLGGPWPEPCKLRPQVRERTEKDGYRIESITFEAEPGDRIPALMLIPDGVDANHPAPAIALWHQHNGEYHLGKSEPAGLAGNPMHHTGVALVKEGYVVLAPDALCFEERQSKHLEGEKYEKFEFLRYVVGGTCMAWKNILDMRRAIDYLCSRAEVQTQRIGCYGHSMGSTHTWLVGPWEPRLKCLVGNCCMPTYAAIHRTHLLHCFPNFIPGWLQYGDTPDVVAMIAPRPLHLNFGETDAGSPIPEVRDGFRTIARAYDAAGAGDKFSSYIEQGAGHVLSDEMWTRTRQWFAKHL